MKSKNTEYGIQEPEYRRKEGERNAINAERDKPVLTQRRDNSTNVFDSMTQ